MVVSYDELEAKNYSMLAGQYFEIKIEYTDISEDQFQKKLESYQNNLNELFENSKKLNNEIRNNLKNIKSGF